MQGFEKEEELCLLSRLDRSTLSMTFDWLYFHEKSHNILNKILLLLHILGFNTIFHYGNFLFQENLRNMFSEPLMQTETERLIFESFYWTFDIILGPKCLN